MILIGVILVIAGSAGIVGMIGYCLFRIYRTLNVIRSGAMFYQNHRASYDNKKLKGGFY